MSVLDSAHDQVNAAINPAVELVARNQIAVTAWVVGFMFAPVSLAFPAAAVVLTVYLYGL